MAGSYEGKACLRCFGNKEIPWDRSPSGAWERDESIRRANAGRWVKCPDCNGTGIERNFKVVICTE